MVFKAKSHVRNCKNHLFVKPSRSMMQVPCSVLMGKISTSHSSSQQICLHICFRCHCHGNAGHSLLPERANMGLWGTRFLGKSLSKITRWSNPALLGHLRRLFCDLYLLTKFLEIRFIALKL